MPTVDGGGDIAPAAEDAFSVLGNETRLSILLSLWEAYDPHADENAVGFSELRDRVGIRQGAQFNYHLDKVVGHFVEKTQGGYELRPPGRQIVQTVIAGSGLEEPSVEETHLDDECTLCGAPTAITYHDGLLYHVCMECGGYFGDQPGHPSGVLSAYELDPAGISDRTPKEMFHAAATEGYWTFQSAIEGVCDVCTGPMDQSLDICHDHADEGVCDNCGRRPAVIARFVCSVCKANHQAPPFVLVARHPAVVSFYYERDVPMQYEVTEFEDEQRRRRHLKSHEQYLMADDPPRVRVVVKHDGDELRLTLDENLDVVGVEEPD